MMQWMSAGQRALIEAELQRRQHELEQRIAAAEGGEGRVAQAAQILADDPDAPREHEGDREVALARADQLRVEQEELGAALLRLRAGDYGLCRDCGEAIAFDRLKAQPQALRCLGCQARAEG